MKSIEYPTGAERFQLDTTIPRLTQPHDVRALLALIADTSGSIVEIGCNRGLTTRDIALAFPDRLVYAFDYCVRGTGMHEHQEGERPSPEWFCDFARELPNVVCVHALQPNYKALVDVGFIFIDGDHSFDGCVRDTESAWQHLSIRPGGGIMAWHDVYDGAPEWVGVERAIRVFDGATFDAVKINDSWVAFAQVEGKNTGPLGAVGVACQNGSPEGETSGSERGNAESNRTDGTDRTNIDGGRDARAPLAASANGEPSIAVVETATNKPEASKPAGPQTPRSGKKGSKK